MTTVDAACKALAPTSPQLLVRRANWAFRVPTASRGIARRFRRSRPRSSPGACTSRGHRRSPRNATTSPRRWRIPPAHSCGTSRPAAPGPRQECLATCSGRQVSLPPTGRARSRPTRVRAGSAPGPARTRYHSHASAPAELTGAGNASARGGRPHHPRQARDRVLKSWPGAPMASEDVSSGLALPGAVVT